MHPQQEEHPHMPQEIEKPINKSLDKVYVGKNKRIRRFEVYLVREINMTRSINQVEAIRSILIHITHSSCLQTHIRKFTKSETLLLVDRNKN